MSDEPKDVAKSLHTVTVILQVARHLIAAGKPVYIGPNVAIHEAMTILGLNDRPDPHGLRAKARRLLDAGK